MSKKSKKSKGSSSIFGEYHEESVKAEKERVGGAVFKTGILDAKVTGCSLLQGKTGSRGLAITIDINGFTKTLREYFKSGKDKGYKNYYMRGKVKMPLPGYTMCNALTMATIGKPIGKTEKLFKKKIVKGFNGKKEKQLVLEKVIGKKIKVAAKRVVLDKPKKKKGVTVYDKKTGKPKPSGEFFETIEISAILDSKGRTLWEIENKVKKPDFAKKFDKKWAKQKEPLDWTTNKAYTKKAKSGGGKKGKKSKKGKSSGFM